MSLTKLSITKPIAITMFILLFVALGIVGAINLGADLFPPANIPVISISSTYPGAGADEIEKDIIKPIEDAASAISGLDTIQSYAYEGYAQVIVMFKMSADINTAYMDTQKAIDSIVDKLPKDASRPALLKYDLNASPILIYTLSGDRPYEEIYSKTEEMKERVERIEGVGSVSIFGGMEKELSIKADKSKLEYYGLSLGQVLNRLQTDNISLPGGIIKQTGQDRIVSIEGEFTDINQIIDFRIPVGREGGYVRLGDIAEVSLEYPNAKEISRVNGKQAIGLIVQKQSDANIVETGNKVKSEIDKFKKSIDNLGLELNLVQDSTVFITSSLDDTKKNLIEGVIITALILFLFLRQWNTVSIAVVAIPTSLVSTFFMMYIMKFSFNILSLMGLTLCVGILVDDSVVVLENIHRHFKMGKDAKTASLEGRSEIGMAAIAITLSDVVVFAPIAFMSGIIGQYFKQFGLVVVFATLFSLLVSFTVTPMMASRMFKEGNSKAKRFQWFYTFMDNSEEKLKELYGKVLVVCLRNRVKVALVILVLLAVSVSFLFTGRIGMEFMPYTDSGEFTIHLSLDPGATIESTDEKTKQVEEYIKNLKDRQYYYSRVGSVSEPNKSSIFVKLVDKTKRSSSQKDIITSIRDWAGKNMSGVEMIVSEASMVDMGGESGKPINIIVKGSNTEVINEIANQVEDVVKSTEGTVETGNSFENGKPAYKVSIDKISSSNYGISAYDISNTVRSSIEGVKAGVFRKDGEEFDVKLKLQDNSIKDQNDLNNLYIMSNTGKMIPIDQLAKISLSDSPANVKRQNKQRLCTISANISKGHTLGEVSSKINKKIKNIELPDGYSISVGGEQEMMSEIFVSLTQVLIISVLLVYMILVVLYESFLTPLVRILALPVGFIGALTALMISGNSLNMLSMIGLIMLDGLAAKNGTILIDYTNTLMSRGMELRDALLEAGKTRLKPIIMTSAAMIVGMLPSALAIGNGSEFKLGLALVIIGGMISSTILSPILLPIAYTFIDDFQKKLKRIFSRKKNTEVMSL